MHYCTGHTQRKEKAFGALITYSEKMEMKRLTFQMARIREVKGLTYRSHEGSIEIVVVCVRKKGKLNG